MLPTRWQPMNDKGAEPESIAHLPRMIPVGDVLAPQAPLKVEDTGVSKEVLSDLLLKAAYTVPQLTTQWAVKHLLLPQPLVAELLEQLRTDFLLETLGQAGPLGYRYAISQRGRERANRVLEISGYIGPAPVSLATYTAMIDWQYAQCPSLSPELVKTAIAPLVLRPEDVDVAGLAISSGRSLFLFGPPGNGKTSLGRLLHSALQGDFWVPHCIGIDNTIIRIFDPQCHQLADFRPQQPWLLDQRWVRIRRPLIVSGGELTLDSCDLAYIPSLRYYEAPAHLKANGGTYLIDDFGRQRVDPHELLNRWIIPLEHQIDYLTLHTGLKIHVPFRQMLIVATNLDLQTVSDPAFLRRMGYRLCLEKPSSQRYKEIFHRYADGMGVLVPPGLLARLMNRYLTEERELHCCEPRDLLERVRDICHFQDRSLELNEEILDLAWAGYFGTSQAGS
jgi:hypothetical protein